MRDFFTFFTDIKHMDMPFTAFHIIHFVFLFMSIGIALYLLRFYRRLDKLHQKKFLKGMAIYYLVEEALYTLWLLIFCHDHVLIQILPFELCSICAYMNALCVFTNNRYLKFYSGVVPLIAGLVAMIYPANISDLYPVFSYRVINFYMLHGSFILFSIIQLQDKALLQYCYMRRNMWIIAGMYSFAFFVNLILKTQYMFVGTPPQISFIAHIYHMSGMVLFLPVIITLLCIIQFLVVFIMRKVCHTENVNVEKIS